MSPVRAIATALDSTGTSPGAGISAGSEVNPVSSAAQTSDTQAASRQATYSALVLALDTCGPETTLALDEWRADQWHGVEVASLPPRTAASRLTGALAALLGSRQPRELAAVVVVRGPGSFTGMRIGLAAAKALANGADVPILAVSRLAVLGSISGTRYTALDAGRGNIYLRDAQAVAESQGGTGEWMLTLAEAQQQLHGVPAAAIAICEDKLALLFSGALRVEVPRAMDALHYAQARLQARDWDDAASLDALYLWREEQMLIAATARQ